MNKNDIVNLLKLDDPGKIEELFDQARKVREKAFSNKVFLYGFVYFSTYCRKNCNFCYYRNYNDIERYRKEPEEIIAIANQLAESGVHVIDLTMGEDMKYHRENFKTVLNIVKEIKRATGLPVMISPGVIKKSLIKQFAALDTEWYALYQETHNKKLFSELRIHQDYNERMQAKLYAKEQGMLIEEGILAGVGETLEDIADSIIAMGQIGARQVRVMSFIPQKGIPMENVQRSDILLELKIIAILRLKYPDSLVPASLDVDGINGLKDRMNAGANVITSIIPPRSGFAGVAQKSMDVDDGGRTVKQATVILRELGLEPATNEEYKKYLLKLRTKI